VLLAAYSALAQGCGSNVPESQKPTQDQCDDFERAYCDKTAECAQSSDRADFREECEFSFQVYLPCEQVTYIVSDTQDCIDATDNIECSSVMSNSFPKLPDACQGNFGSR
jgi:hypothetical protein